MAIRALIVDDESIARKGLRTLLRDDEDIAIVGEAPNGRRAVTAIRELRPSIVFLDVQMPELDGFGVIDEVGVDAMPATIFVTAYDQYALAAFEVHAVGYLLKPFDRDRFARTLQHAKKRLAQPAEQGLGPEALKMLDALRSQPRPVNEIRAPNQNTNGANSAQRYQSANIVAKFAAHSAIGGGPPGRPWPYPLISAYTSAERPVNRAAIVVQSAAYHAHRVRIAKGVLDDGGDAAASRVGDVIVDEDSAGG